MSDLRLAGVTSLAESALITGFSANLSAVAILACWLPARRATCVNPIEALRAE